jgi:hypothetical protein
MFIIFAKPTKKTFLYCLLFLAGSLCQAAQQTPKGGTPNTIKGVWDPGKHIAVDEIQPGMEAYCLTVYKGTEIEKFDMEVLDVVRNWAPGKDAILVQGTDERFIHTGPVRGCSGSPVYIDGRLAGALARAAFFSKDPFYLVTPIEEMLRVGQTSGPNPGAPGPGFVFDLSVPLDFGEINEQMSDSRYWNLDSPQSIQHRAYSFDPLPCPLVTSGLPSEVVEQLDAFIKPFGLVAVAGTARGTSSGGRSDRNEGAQGAPQLVPGACLAVPLATGDITIAAIGAVTEVLDDKVYGFGHSFLGYGPIDLPMATGKVHAVVSNMFFSFKFASAVEVIGALTTDESTAICGQIGAKARMIPLAIRVDRYNDAETRVYDCQLANNRLLTPSILQLSVAGAALMLGSLPPDHMIEYKVTIGLEDAEPITFENVSTSLGLTEMVIETKAPVALLMNNPYKSINIESVDVDMRIVPKNIVSHIWSVELSDSKIKAGQELEFEVVVESFLAEKKKYQGRMKIPDELAPGKYDLLVCGGYDYLQFLRKAAQYRFVPQNLSGLIEAINNILAVRRDKLYCLLALPAGGVAVEKAELPDLPATKALILRDVKRTLRTQSYQHWLEKTFRTGTIIIDKKVMRITVEK